MVSDVPLARFLAADRFELDCGYGGAAHRCAAQDFLDRLQRARLQRTGIPRVVATEFGTDHHELTLGPDALDQLEDLAWHLDEPFGDSSAIPTYMVSKLAAETVKVVLSGTAGRIVRRLRQVPGRATGEESQAFAGRRPEGAGKIGRNMPTACAAGTTAAHIADWSGNANLDACTLFRRDDMKKLSGPMFTKLPGAL